MSARPSFLAAPLLLLLSAATALAAPALQQGTKLVGAGSVGTASQGYSVSVSMDGNTAIAGGYTDNSSAGAAWVYTRSAGVWSQQGAKLVGTGAVGAAFQGYAVAVSGDGNTAILGGYDDNSQAGAAWIFTRTAGVWSQQGAKLVGTGAVGTARQGYSLALSADGNTALVGGEIDNGGVGATWVYTRSAGVWSQQGIKLVGTGSVGASVAQGYSIALSADGNTALVGGFADNSSVGAAWVYTRSAGVWTQQGTKLVGTGAVGASRQGYAVSLSGDGNTAIVGGYGDNGTTGAVWVYTRTAGVWTQQGPKLVATGEVGAGFLGVSVAASSDGNTTFVGGYGDNGFTGAAWVYTRSAGTWTQQGTKLVGTGAIGAGTGQGFSVAMSADGKTGIVGGYGDNSLAGAIWVFVDPTPAIVAITDVPNDQGGKVNLRWSASLADNQPFDPIDTYWIWRQVPGAVAAQALSDGATLEREVAAAGPRGRMFRTSTDGAQVYYWEYVGSQAADGYPGYSYTAPTTSDSLPGSNPYTLFIVEAKQLSTGARWPSQPDSGYSADNLPPAPPAPFTGSYTAGATRLHWGMNAEADFSTYRLYRGTSALFVPGPANRVTVQPDTGYVDPGAAGSYYKLSAVDLHGNESTFALVAPGSTTGVPDPAPLAFALDGVRPNPVKGAELRVSFTLADGTTARLELLDTGGRRVVAREVGVLGAGQHSLDLADGRRVAPGLYWVRLSQGTNRRFARVAVIE